MKQTKLHDSNASMYRKKVLQFGSLPTEPSACGSLLGGNYQFLFYPLGWPVTFSSSREFHPWRDEFMPFNLSLPCFLDFPIQQRQGRPSLETFLSDANVLKVDFDLISLSTLISVLAGYTFLYDSWWPQSPSDA